MDDQVTTIYCVTDDFLLDLGHNESLQHRVSDAEVLTVALVAARYFACNYEAAWRFLTDYRYMTRRLSRSQFNRRLANIMPYAERLFLWLAEIWKRLGPELTFAIDSMPVPCCDNARIKRCRLYPLEATNHAFRGYIASKRRYFYGVKLHLVVNEFGHPVEMHLAPGRCNDTGELKKFNFDLPPGSIVYGDKAYGNDYVTEDLLAEAGTVELVGLRRKGSRRARDGWICYLIEHYRKRIETSFSLIAARLPKSIHAVTARGFETKVFLFVLALSMDGLL